MRVAEAFKFSQCENLDIAASALYLLAAPSTSAFAREEALERATLGDVNRHKEAAKPEVSKPVTVDVPAEKVVSDSSTPASPRPGAQTVEAQTAAVVEQFEDKLPGKEIEARAHFQLSNRSHDMAPATDSGELIPKNKADLETQSLFEVGHHICLTDFGQQETKWIGEVAEVKEATATQIEVVIRISLRPLQVEE